MALTALDGALAMARRGLAVHPVWGIVERELEDADGNVIGAATDCACPASSRTRNERGECRTAGKHPIYRPWGSTMDPATIARYDEDQPGCNWGVALAEATVVDVDFRHGGGRTYDWWLEQADCPLAPTLVVRTGDGLHLYYLGEQAKAGGKLLRRDSGIDFKSGTDAQVVCPGSSHLSGATYEVREDRPIARPTGALPIAGREERDPSSASLPAGGLTEERVAEGGRNDFIIERGAALRNLINDEVAFRAAMLALNARCCDPPFSPEEMAEKLDWLWAREGGGLFHQPLSSPTELVAADRAASVVRTVGELLLAPPPDWEVADLVPEAGITVLFGDGGTKKSFVALDWALTAALGRPWHGHVLRPRRTLYVAAEGVAGLPDRVRAWGVREGLDGDDELVDANLPVWFYPGAVDLRNPDAVRAVAELAGEREVDRIVIDTLRRAMPGGDENSATDVGTVIGACEYLANGPAGASVLLLHHSPAADGRRPRGSTAIRDDCDVALGLERVDAMTSNLLPSKLKDAAEFEPLRISFGEKEVGNDRTSLVATRLGAAVTDGEAPPRRTTALERCAARLDLLRLKAEPGCEWRTAELIETFGCPRSTGERIIRQLRDAGRLREVGHGVYG